MLPGQRFIEDRLVGAMRAWMIVGILLRVTRLRDRFDLPAVIFYSTPWPVLAIGFGLLALHFWRRAQWHPVRRYVAFLGLAIFTWIATSWYSAEPLPGTPDLRIIQWNVARPLDRVPGCAEWLRAQNADVICLSESMPEGAPIHEVWQREFPGYELSMSAANMMCLVRGQILDSRYVHLGRSSHAQVRRLRVRGREFTLIQTDIVALPRTSRRLPLRNLLELVGKQPAGEVILAGDFNTPRESIYFDELRQRFDLAFEVAGRGLAETWPSYAPALAIDHVWIDRGWKALACEHGVTWRSDHRPVVVDLAAPPGR